MTLQRSLRSTLAIMAGAAIAVIWIFVTGEVIANHGFGGQYRDDRAYLFGVILLDYIRAVGGMFLAGLISGIVAPYNRVAHAGLIGIGFWVLFLSNGDASHGLWYYYIVGVSMIPVALLGGISSRGLVRERG